MTTRTWLTRTFLASLLAFFLGSELGFAYESAKPLPTPSVTTAPALSSAADPGFLWGMYIARVRRGMWWWIPPK